MEEKNNEQLSQYEMNEQQLRELTELAEARISELPQQSGRGYLDIPVDRLPCGSLHPMIDYRMIPPTRQYNK